MSSPIISIKQGHVKGKTLKNRHGGSFFSFQNIPYAKPPLGRFRFKAPQPPEPWTGIRDASKEGSECFSPDPITQQLVGSEDCLILNVYTPALPKSNSDKPKPVMFYIHGGAFVNGSSKTILYGPEHLLTEDIVLVTINYRIGLLGFLTLEDQSLGVPGNAGLKDMVMALRWVQQNIKNFMGDPNNVTIFGESAGGLAVHLLYISPMSQGLFHKAIAQSGCAFNTWAKAITNSQDVAKSLGIAYTHEKELLQKLQEVELEDLMSAQEALDDSIMYGTDIRRIGFTIEKQTNEPAFLPEDPWDAILAGKYNKLPLMMGYTNREAMLYDLIVKLDKKKDKDRFPKDFEYLVPHPLGVKQGSELSKKIAQKIKEFYADNEDLSEDNIDKDYVMRTDIFFLRGIYSAVRAHINSSNAPIYLYRVSVESALNMYKILIGTTKPGVCHADELGYLFKNLLTPDIAPGSLEDNSVTRFVKLWTNFARTGNPNPETKDSLIGVTWMPVTKAKMNFLDIGEELTTGVNPEGERMRFWDDILEMDEEIQKRF